MCFASDLQVYSSTWEFDCILADDSIILNDIILQIPWAPYQKKYDDFPNDKPNGNNAKAYMIYFIDLSLYSSVDPAELQLPVATYQEVKTSVASS